MSFTAIRPVPWTEEFAPDYTKQRGTRNYDFAWAAADARACSSSSWSCRHLIARAPRGATRGSRRRRQCRRTRDSARPGGSRRGRSP